MDVSENSGTKSSILKGVFHYKSSILGYPYFWKHPHIFDVFVLFVAGLFLVTHLQSDEMDCVCHLCMAYTWQQK